MEQENVIRIGGNLVIPEDEIHYEACRASGNGGQNVNVTDSAVQLRFNIVDSPSLPDDVRIRLLAMGGKSVNSKGELVIKSQKFRQQLRNKYAAREVFISLLLKARTKRKARIRTGVPKFSKEVRLELKKRVSVIKRHRKSPPTESLDD